MDLIVPKPLHPFALPLVLLLLVEPALSFVSCTLPLWRVANGQLGERNQVLVVLDGALRMNWSAT